MEVHPGQGGEGASCVVAELAVGPCSEAGHQVLVAVVGPAEAASRPWEGLRVGRCLYSL